MKITPVLHALKPVLETAAHLVVATRAARAESANSEEEIANLEKIAAEQAALSRELADQVGELARLAALAEESLRQMEERLDAVNRQRGWMWGVVLASASLALTALVLVLTRGG